MNDTNFQVIVIGGGFYGCCVASYLKNHFDRVLIVEREKELLRRASYWNQARIHKGFHYPRTFNTAFRSHKNSSQFIEKYSRAVVNTTWLHKTADERR